MKRLLYIFLLSILVFPLHAQELMTLQQARNLALKKSEDVKIATKTLEKAEAQKAAVQTNYLPSLSGSATGVFLQKDLKKEMYLPTFNSDPATGELRPNIVTDGAGNPVIGTDGNPQFAAYAYLPLEISLQGALMAGINVEQPIYVGGKIKAGNEMAAIGINMAYENQRLQKINTIVEADKAYWLYVSVQEKVKLAKSSVEMLAGLLERVQDSYDVGLINRNEVLKVQVQYNNARLNLQKAQSGLELTRMSLCRVTGLALNTSIQTDSVIGTSNILQTKGANEDLTLRPEYQLMVKNIAMEEQNIKLTKSEFLPTVGISAGLNYLSGVEINGDALNQQNMTILASVKIPVFHWGEGRRKIASAKADQSIKELELEKNTQLLQLEIERARFNLNDASFRIETTNTALEQAAENLRISNDNYDVGRELMTDLLTAQTQWQKAYNDVIEAKTEHQLYETEYLRVTSNLLLNE